MRLSQAPGQAVIVRSSSLSLNRHFGSSRTKSGMPSRKLARGLRWVVGDPFRPAARRIVHEPHDTVGRDDIGTGGDQGRVGLKLLGDMSLGVIGIQNDQDLVAGPKESAGAVDDIRRGGISLDQCNIACKLVGFDRPTVRRADLDVHPHHATLAAHRLEQGGIEGSMNLHEPRRFR